MRSLSDSVAVPAAAAAAPGPGRPGGPGGPAGVAEGDRAGCEIELQVKSSRIMAWT